MNLASAKKVAEGYAARYSAFLKKESRIKFFEEFLQAGFQIEKSVEYMVRAKIFEKLFHFGSENRKIAGYLYEGIKNFIVRSKTTLSNPQKKAVKWKHKIIL